MVSDSGFYVTFFRSLPHTFVPSETEEGVQAVLDELKTRVAKRRILVRDREPPVSP